MKSHATALLVVFAMAACATPKKQQIVNTPPVVAVSDPNIVTLEGLVDNDYVRASSKQEVMVRLRIDTREIELDDRPQLNLALAIDTSGSMEGEAIEHARAAALELVDKLRDGDRISVVVFSSTATVLVPNTEISDANRATVTAQIGEMTARGTTDLANGLAQALAQARSATIADGVNRIVLLSDGVPNDATHIRAIADQAKGSHISITALGLGLDYDESLLGEVAQRSGGTFHFIEEPEHVAKVFSEEIARLERLVARNMNLSILPGPGVVVTAVIGQNAGASGRAYYVNLGDLAAGEQRDVFVKLAIEGRKDGANVELLDAFLTFQDAVANAGALKRDLFLAARATEDEAKLKQGARPELAREALRAELAAVVLQALQLARAGQQAQAKALLVAAEPRARSAGKEHGDDELIAQADEIVKLIASLPAIVPVQVATPQPQPGLPDPAPQPDAMEEAPADAPAAIRKAHGKAMEQLQPKSRGARFRAW